MPERDVRIISANHFEGPDALAAILGFLGVDPNACLIPPSRAAAGPGGREPLADMAW